MRGKTLGCSMVWRVFCCALGFSAAMLSCEARAGWQIPVKSYAQELVDRTIAEHPDLRAMVMHVTPPGATENIVLASSIGRIGKAADRQDLEVISSGKTRVVVDAARKRIEVETPLRDISGHDIGALALVWRFPLNGSRTEFESAGLRIRDALERRILNLGNLLEPYPYEPGVTTKSRAQTLVDDALLRHPEVIVLAIRGRDAATQNLVLLGSTFGRHGKSADADDLKVLGAPEPVTGIYSSGRRFGVDMPLFGRTGAPVGTVNVGYSWRPGADARALLAQAISLRDELQLRMEEPATLWDVDP
jgi:hypothetical protein